MPAAIPPPVLPDGGRRPLAVVCLGHALVDRLAEAPPGVVSAAGLELGAMTLVGAEAARVIEQQWDHWQEVAGGSAANTAAGVASLGGSAAFVGSIGADEAGRRYVADLEAAGVRCVAHPAGEGSQTGLCHVLVGADGTRSMATSLGAAAEISPAAVEEAGIGQASVVYIEGYLLDAPPAASALSKAVELARGAGTLVSLSLSDPFVVERHRDAILGLVEGGEVDVLFGNEEEARSLAGVASLEEAVEALRRPGLLALVTRGAEGSVAVSADALVETAAEPVSEVVDTTGAGDLFAAGVLYGLTSGRDAAAAARVGSLAASEIIGHFGARPLADLAEIVAGS